MIILAALLLGILTGARTFMALALVSGYALVIAPQPLIPAFGWLSDPGLGAPEVDDALTLAGLVRPVRAHGEGHVELRAPAIATLLK